MYQETKGLGGSRIGQSTNVDMPEVIRESGPIGKASETLSYLNELDSLHSAIRRKIYGNFPEAAGTSEKRADSPSLEEMLSMICQRVAALTGDAKNLLSRLD